MGNDIEAARGSGLKGPVEPSLPCVALHMAPGSQADSDMPRPHHPKAAGLSRLLAPTLLPQVLNSEATESSSIES